MLDESTLLLVSGIVVLMCSIVFILNATLRRDDAVGRLWCVAYLAGILLTLAYGIASTFPAAAWWAVPVGNAGLVVVVGAIWSGCRLASRRRPLLLLVMATAVAAGLASLIPEPRGEGWSGAVAVYIAVSGFAALTVRETVTGSFRRSLHARVLTAVFLTVAVFYLARTMAFIAYGPVDERFLTLFGTSPTTLINLGLMVTSTVSLSTIQAERLGRIRGTSAADEVAEMPGVLGPTQFHRLGSEWMRRAAREQRTLKLVLIDLGSLEEINLAFGRALGNEAIASVARIAVAEAPAAALIGHVEPGRFAVLSPVIAGETPTEGAERIKRRVLAEPGDHDTGFRALCSYAVVTTRSTGFDIDALLTAGTSSIESLDQPGSIALVEAH